MCQTGSRAGPSDILLWLYYGKVHDPATAHLDRARHFVENHFVDYDVSSNTTFGRKNVKYKSATFRRSFSRTTFCRNY